MSTLDEIESELHFIYTEKEDLATLKSKRSYSKVFSAVIKIFHNHLNTKTHLLDH